MELEKFEGHNVIIASNQPPYKPMPAYRFGDDSGTTLICWKLGFWERLNILWTGRIWHFILTFDQPMQPQKLQAESPLEIK